MSQVVFQAPVQPAPEPVVVAMGYLVRFARLLDSVYAYALTNFPQLTRAATFLVTLYFTYRILLGFVRWVWGWVVWWTRVLLLVLAVWFVYSTFSRGLSFYTSDLPGIYSAVRQVPSIPDLTTVDLVSALFTVLSSFLSTLPLATWQVETWLLHLSNGKTYSKRHVRDSSGRDEVREMWTGEDWGLDWVGDNAQPPYIENNAAIL